MANSVYVSKCLDLKEPTKQEIVIDNYDDAVTYFKKFYFPENIKKIMKSPSGLSMIFRFGVASTKFYYNNETDHDTIKCIMDDDYPEIITNIILKITNNLQYDIDQKGSFVKTSKSLYLLVPKVTGIIKLQGDIDYGHGFIDAQITLREDDDGSLWTKATYLSDELEDRFETDDLSKQNTVTILTEINDDNGPITTIREKIQEKCQLRYQKKYL